MEAGFAPYDAWLSQCLQYRQLSDEEEGGLGGEVAGTGHRALAAGDERPPRGADTGTGHLTHSSHPPTLVPLQETLLHFSDFVDKTASRKARSLCIGPLAFDRETAAGGGAALLRIGHPFIDRLLKFVTLDERGTAWAMWRHASNLRLSEPDLYFSFDVVVEADEGPGRAVLAKFGGSPAALRRRLDAALSPERLTIWVDSEGEVMKDGARREALELPYKPSDEGGTDTNLRPDRWAAAEAALVVGSWANTCRAARASAERSIRQATPFVRRCADAVKSQARLWQQTRAVLESRFSRLEEPALGAERALLAFEAALTDSITRGIENPSVRVEAAGAVILAPRPFAALDLI
jgi:hypothetical protein